MKLGAYRSHAGIPTASGGWFDFGVPELGVYTIEDIATGLANLCRFAGQVKFYSVAEHSILVSRIVPSEHARAALMHDAAEAFLGDVVRPLKAMLPDYRRVERDAEQAIRARFGLPNYLDASIKAADLAVYAAERAQLVHPDQQELTGDEADLVPASVQIFGYAPDRARDFFLSRYRELTAPLGLADAA